MDKIEITHWDNTLEIELNLSEETKQKLLWIEQEKVWIKIEWEDVVITIEGTKEYFKQIIEW